MTPFDIERAELVEKVVKILSDLGEAYKKNLISSRDYNDLRELTLLCLGAEKNAKN